MNKELENRNHCFLLGAGFSCAYSDAAPAMANFLNKALDKQIYQPDTLHKELAELATKYFGCRTTPEIEMLASFLVQKTAYVPTEEPPRAVAYEQLVKVIMGTLKEIYVTPRGDDEAAIFRRFAGVVAAGAMSVVTLNYDLLLDQLLIDTGNWSPRDGGYGVALNIAGAQKAPPGIAHAAPDNPPPKQALLLKLHGSLNWGKRTSDMRTGPVRSKSLLRVPCRVRVPFIR